jgi:hypothetical protein
MRGLSMGKIEKERGKVKAYFCPRCKSVRVGYVFRIGNLFGLMPKMECKDCGFSAMGFPILVSNKKSLEALGKGKTKKKVVKKKTGGKKK